MMMMIVLGDLESVRAKTKCLDEMKLTVASRSYGASEFWMSDGGV